MSIGPRERHEFWDDCQLLLQPVWQGCLDRARARLAESEAAAGLAVVYPEYPAPFIANLSVADGAIELKPAFPLLTYLWFRGRPGSIKHAEIWSQLRWGREPTSEPVAALSADDRAAFLVGDGIDQSAIHLAQMAVEFFIDHEIGHHYCHHKPGIKVLESELAADAFAMNCALKTAAGDVRRAMGSLSGFLAGSMCCPSKEDLYPSNVQRLDRLIMRFTGEYGLRAYRQWRTVEESRCDSAGVLCRWLQASR
jgi:hypothetical protein